MSPTDRDNVLPLGKEPPPESRVLPARHTRSHGLSIVGMALSALVGIVGAFLFVTVNWPGRSGRYVLAIVFLAAIAFLASASIAVFTAARDTHATSRRT